MLGSNQRPASGEEDRLVRPVRLEVPWASSVILPGCGHLPMWDDSPLVSRVILEATETAGTEPSTIAGLGR